MGLTMCIEKRIYIGAKHGTISPNSSINLKMVGSGKTIPVDLSKVKYITEDWGSFQGCHIQEYMDRFYVNWNVLGNEIILDKDEWQSVLDDCKKILQKNPNWDRAEIMPMQEDVEYDDDWYYDTITEFAAALELVVADTQEDVEFIYSYTY